MSRITSLDLAPFYRNSIGIDRFMEQMQDRLLGANASTYPPYNIIEVDENNFRIEMAVAGFTKDEIDVTVEDRQLLINGNKESDVSELSNLAGITEKFVHKGIANRNFRRSFALAEHVEVKSGEMENGILSVELEKVVPEELKPKKIDINFKQ